MASGYLVFVIAILFFVIEYALLTDYSRDFSENVDTKNIFFDF